MIDKSLEILSLMNDRVQVILKNVTLYKWKGSSKNAQNYINKNSNKTNKLLYSDVTNFTSKDCLYIGENKDDKLIYIYLSDHLISYHPTEGYATIDLLYRGNLKYEAIACPPKVKYRTFDNKSVEIFYPNDGDENSLLDNKYITLGLYSERYAGGDRVELLKSMLSFLDNTRKFFEKTFYIPYIIHPYRLVLFKNNTTKLISCNLLHYILCPYIEEKKLSDVLFIHPFTITPDKKNALNSKALLKMCTRNIILDFFHSFFVTIIWILCENKQKLYDNRNFCNGLFRNYKIMLDQLNNKNRHKKQKLINIDPLKEVLPKEEEEEDDNNKTFEIDGCKNAFGYCQINDFDENERKIIHQYSCERLNITPVALDIILDGDGGEGTINQLKNFIDKEFSELRQFIQTFLEC